MQTIVTGCVLLALFVFLIRISLAEGQRRARAELEAENAEKQVEARSKMDEAMREEIGKRWKLVEWARERLSR